MIADRVSVRRAALVAGLAYLITDATSISSIFVIRPSLLGADPAVTSRLVSTHEGLFRLGILLDLISSAGVVVLNVALYALLAPVAPQRARVAAMWRMLEVATGAGLCLFGVAVTAIDAPSAAELSPELRRMLVHTFATVQATGFAVVMFFFGCGSAMYMHLFLTARSIPRWLARLGLVGSLLPLAFSVVRLQAPMLIMEAAALVRALPVSVRVVIGLFAAPLTAFELILGTWLVVHGAQHRDAISPRGS